MKLDRTYARWMVLPTLLVALFLSVSSGSAFTALYVFGDSLSDTGRNPASPPTSYYNGRYCNGPLWVEYLSAQLGLAYNASNNFAVSGSTTSNLLSQIAGLPASTNLRSGLCTIVSGGNDFLQNSSFLTTNDAAWAVLISNGVANIMTAVGTLYTNGAREILVGNLPDLGKIPAYQTSPAGYTNYISSRVTLWNAQLATAVSNAPQKYLAVRVYLQDNNAAFAKVYNAPATYGFTVITNGALEDPNLTDKSFNGPGANYLFWDVVHPTTKLNVRTSADAFRLVAAQMNLARNGTNFSLTVTNLYPGLPYTLQSSSNLTAWSNLQSFTAASTNTNVVVTNGAKKVFYRVGY